jgi:hypothetical protein
MGIGYRPVNRAIRRMARWAPPDDANGPIRLLAGFLVLTVLIIVGALWKLPQCEVSRIQYVVTDE